MWLLLLHIPDLWLTYDYINNICYFISQVFIIYLACQVI